jgi:hypothetical protein
VSREVIDTQAQYDRHHTPDIVLVSAPAKYKEGHRTEYVTTIPLICDGHHRAGGALTDPLTALIITAMLPRIEPINPTRLAAPFDHPDWLFELKHDVAYSELVSKKQIVYKGFQ